MKILALCCCFVATLATAQEPAKPRELSHKFVGKSLVIQYGNRPLMTYVYEDDKIPRPYIANVYSTEGRRITRPHPAPDGPNNDHGTFHPGIWLSFGDLNGEDFWRNKARTRGTRPVIVESTHNRLQFSAPAVFEAETGNTLGVMNSTYYVSVKESFCIIDMIFEFRPLKGTLIFGDQEEMGLGIRLDTPLTVEFGAGIIQNDNGGKNEAGTWGKVSDQCSYWAEIDGRGVGLLLTPHPDNFRPSWFHSRDYGLLVANPFGRNAMTGGEESRVEVHQRDPLLLGFTIVVFDFPADLWRQYYPNLQRRN